MLENKKILVIGAIIIILGIGGILYYMWQNSTEEYINFESFDTIEENNVEEIMQNTIENEEKEEIIIHISGQVVNPGVVSLKEGARIIDAINKAGGLTQQADINQVNLAYILTDAQKIYIPSVEEKENSMLDQSDKTQIITDVSVKNDSTQKGSKMININTASIEQLQELPGIGSSIAGKIVVYREENGKFNTIEDIQNVSGIGSSKFEKIKNNICVK